MVKKKKVYDNVMLLTRLKEEEVIVVREVKQHWEYLRNTVGLIEELSSQLSEGKGQQRKSFFIFYLFIFFCNLHGFPELVSFVYFLLMSLSGSTEALTERGREGLLCLLRRRLSAVKAQQDAARTTYQRALGLQALSLDDSSTDDEENLDSSSSSDEEL